jgi:hypothetical protein
MKIGALAGLIVGILLWWSAYEAGAGRLQNARLIVLSTAFGMSVVLLHNRWKKVGAWDTETVAKNRHGRV